MAVSKETVLKCLVETCGVVTHACKKAGICRKTFYNWYNNDEEFKAEVDDIGEQAIDYVESQLFGLIEDKNPAAILFYLKTKGKKRGYVERQEHTGADGESLQPIITPQIIIQKPKELD